MAFKKTFNRSERAAFLALGELFKQGLVDFEAFDFQTMTAGEIGVVRSTDAIWLSRVIIFRKDAAEVAVVVRTPERQGYSDAKPSEIIFWDAERATVLKGGFEREFKRTKYPDHTYWLRGSR